MGLIRLLFQYRVIHSARYSSPIFFLAPFYQRLFPTLKRLAIIDVDTYLNSDVNRLYQNFEVRKLNLKK